MLRQTYCAYLMTVNVLHSIFEFSELESLWYYPGALQESAQPLQEKER